MSGLRDVEIGRYLLLTSLLTPLFPVSVVPAAYVALKSYRRGELAFLVGCVAYVVLTVLRNVFVGAVVAAAIACLYYGLVLRSAAKADTMLFIMTGLGLTAAYFMRSYWYLPDFVNGLCRWWGGSGSSLTAAYSVLIISALSLQLSEEVGAEDSGRATAIEKFVASNPGLLPVLGFTASLLAAAADLALGLEGSANKLAELAYYLLVAGVVLQIYAIAGRRE